MAQFDMDEDHTYFLITIPCHNDFIEQEFVLNTHVTDNVTDNVTDRCSRIIHYINNDTTVSASKMAKLLSVSVRTIKRDIDRMKEQGLIERIGSEKSGYWKIIKMKP